MGIYNGRMIKLKQLGEEELKQLMEKGMGGAGGQDTNLRAEGAGCRRWQV